VSDPRRITILDTTLRDGEQSPGIVLSPDEKVEIAHALDALGVDVIEAGFAVSSPGDFEGVRAVAAAVSRPTVASLARTRPEDLDAAVEALAVASPRKSSTRRDRRSRTSPAGSTRSSSRVRTRRARTRPSSPRSVEPRSRPARRRSTCPTRSGTRSLTSMRASSARSAPTAPSSTGSRSQSTATMTSGSPWRTRSPAFVQERARSSARSTASASALGWQRSRKS
jgi:HMGL-like